MRVGGSSARRRGLHRRRPGRSAPRSCAALCRIVMRVASSRAMVTEATRGLRIGEVLRGPGPTVGHNTALVRPDQPCGSGHSSIVDGRVIVEANRKVPFNRRRPAKTATHREDRMAVISKTFVHAGSEWARLRSPGDVGLSGSRRSLGDVPSDLPRRGSDQTGDIFGSVKRQACRSGRALSGVIKVNSRGRSRPNTSR